jgi:hypothetical protein
VPPASQAFLLWGAPRSDSVKFEDLSAHIHPADRDRIRAAFTATRGIAGAYEIDFRIMIGDEIRWISARGLGNDSGLHNRLMYGVFLGRKQAEEGHELLAGEMSHRMKNLLAIASGTDPTLVAFHHDGERDGVGADGSLDRPGAGP